MITVVAMRDHQRGGDRPGRFGRRLDVLAASPAGRPRSRPATWRSDDHREARRRSGRRRRTASSPSARRAPGRSPRRRRAKVRIESSSASPLIATAMSCAVFSCSEWRISIWPALGGSFSARSWRRARPGRRGWSRRLPRFSVTSRLRSSAAFLFFQDRDAAVRGRSGWRSARALCATQVSSICSAPFPATCRRPPAAGPASPSFRRGGCFSVPSRR